MSDYILEYADGDSRTITAETDAEAIRAALASFGPKAVTSEWEPSGDDCERLLIWASEEESENDDGQKAVAQLKTRSFRLSRPLTLL